VQQLAYELDVQGAYIPGAGKKFFSSPKQPDWLLDPPSLLSSGYQQLFPQSKAVGA